MNENVIILTDNNFNSIIATQDKPIVVDFWAEWCGPCKIVAPVIDELANDFKNIAIIAKCDVDSCPTVAQKFGIRNIPTILFFKNGNIADKQIGVAPKFVFSSKIKELL